VPRNTLRPNRSFDMFNRFFPRSFTMNHTLKFAVTAAVAVFGLAGQAHALINSPANGPGSLFLYAFEDRDINPAATNSAIFGLGLASDFDTTKNQTFDFSSDAAWTTYIATIKNPANIHWGVIGSAYSNGGAGTQFLTTLSQVPPKPLNGGSVNTATTNYNTTITVYGPFNSINCDSSCGFDHVQSGDAADLLTNNAAAMPYTATGNLDTSLNFYRFVSISTKANTNSIETDFATGGDPDYFHLTGNGVLTYTAVAAVPEADSYAMMLAGIGLVGFMVRRRKAA
jgi:hypothetical protein